jgi:hypothetical protein
MPDGSTLRLNAPFPFDAGELVDRCNWAFNNPHMTNFRNTMERKRWLLLPDAAPFFIWNQTQGQRDRQTTVDTFGQYAVRMHATFLFSSIVNGDGDWFKIGASGHAGAEDPNTKAWAWKFREDLAGLAMDSRTGFIEQFFSMLLERSAFDNARLYVGDRPGDLPIVRMSPMRDSAWEMGVGHEPETHWWRQSLSAGEWKRKFPEKDIGPTIAGAGESSTARNDQFTMIHGAMRNPTWTPTLPEQSPADRQWLTFWIAEADRHLVAHSWTSSDPYTAFRCPRRPMEQMGRGPSDEALEEVQMAQRVRMAIIRGYEKGIDPVMLLPDDGVITPPTNEPQGAMVLRADMLTGRGGDPVRYLQPAGFPDKGQEWLTQEIYGAIKRAFGLDLFTLPREPRMLDSQIVGLQEEQSRGVVPLLAPLFAPTARVLARLADVAMRQRRLPLPPRQAQGLKLWMEFKNPLERASRLAEVRAFMQALSLLAQAAQIDPSVRHALKIVEGYQWCCRILGVPERFIASKVEIEAGMQADSQAMAAKAGRETGLDVTTMLKNLGSAARGNFDPSQAGGAPATAGAA